MIRRKKRRRGEKEERYSSVPTTGVHEQKQRKRKLRYTVHRY
jgi:hypothetical protein